MRYIRRFAAQASSPLVIFVIGICLTVLSIVLSYHNTTYNSDDVAIQNGMLSWHPLSGETFYGNSDVGFILQAPIYYLVSFFIEPGRAAMLVGGLILAILNFSAIYWSSLYILRVSTEKFTPLTLAPLLWLSSFGYPLSRLFLSTNAHNIVVGIIFLLIAMVSHLLSSASKLKIESAIILSVTLPLLIGLAIVNDRYFLYFGLIPALGLCGLSLYFKIVSRKRMAWVTLIIVCGFLASIVIHELLPLFGLSLLSGVGNPDLVSTGQIIPNLKNTIRNTFIIMGAYSSHAPVGPILLLTALNTALLVTGVYQGLHLIKKRGVRPELIILSSILFLALSAYAFSDFNKGVLQTYRYLVIVPYIITLLLIIFINHCAKFKYFICIIILLSIPFNILFSSDYAKTIFSAPVSKISATDSQESNYRLIKILEEKNLKKGYSEYWSSHINTYLSQGKLQVLPVRCTEYGSTQPFLWFVNKSNYTKAVSQSFYLFHSDEPQCTAGQINAQFGSPSSIIIEGSYTIYLYNYDLMHKMVMPIRQ